MRNDLEHLQVDELNDPAHLESLRLTWQSLLTRMRHASFFHTLDWLQTYWQHLGGAQHLRVLIVSRHGRVLGIMPLVVRRERTRIGHVRVLTYPLCDWGSWYGPIGPNPTATLVAGLRYLARGRRDWDLLDLRWVDRDNTDHGRTPNALGLAGLESRERIWKTIALIELPDSWDAYWGTRTAKFRHNVRRDCRHLDRVGKVEHLRYRPRGWRYDDDDPRWDLYAECTRIAALSWQSKRHDGTSMVHTEFAEFYRAAHLQAVRNGMLDLNLLTVDSQPVAYSYNYHHQGRLFGLRNGYDPALRRHGAGNVLWWHQLQDSIAREDREMDLAFGSMHYKPRWATKLQQIYHYVHYAQRAPRGQLLRLKHWVDDRRHYVPKDVIATI